MSSLCFYFQVHQPYRLRSFRYVDSVRSMDYFDEQANAEIFRKVAEKSYLPANRVLLGLIRRLAGRFRFAFSITGIAIEQMQRYAPDVLASFQELVSTGAVEILAETYYHSLAAIYDEHEFVEQVRQHEDLMKYIFGVKPKVFRNTELIYDDRIGELVASLGYKGIITEGADDILQGRSPNRVYHNPYSGLPILAKNYALSDDIAFRFSNVNWKGYPLTPDKFAYSVHSVDADVINLFMDYETFGEHQWGTSGIFQFLNDMPEVVLSNRRWTFVTPSEAIAKYGKASSETLSYKRLTSWADKNRDLSAWLGNRIQRSALQEVIDLAPHIRKIDDPFFTTTWRRLQTSDHFYYMCTSGSEDGDVHAYFSPYKSPYVGYIRYMNILKDFRWWVCQRSAELGDREQNREMLRVI